MKPEMLKEALKGAYRDSEVRPGKTMDWLVFTEEGFDATVNTILYQVLEQCTALPNGDQYDTAAEIRRRIKEKFGV